MPTYATETLTTATAGTWYRWTGAYDLATGSDSTATTIIWNDWNATTSTITTANVYDESWTVWVSTDRIVCAAPRRSPEEERARQQEYETRTRAAQAAREIAERKAEELLLQNLTAQQRREFENDGHFVVHGRSGHRYRVRCGRVGNVDMIGRDGRLLHRLCAHPEDDVPVYDTMLAQKLILEASEDDFVRVANRHSITERPLLLPPLPQ